MAYLAPTVFATGFNNPQDMDIDSSNNLYVANGGTAAVIKVSQAGAQTVVASGQNPSSVTFDTAGNVYTAFSSSSTIFKNNNAWASSPLIQNPTSLAVGSSNNVYVLCAGNNSIIQILAH